jgi:ParB family chromosome partitioning protein
MSTSKNTHSRSRGGQPADRPAATKASTPAKPAATTTPTTAPAAPQAAPRRLGRGLAALLRTEVPVQVATTDPTSTSPTPTSPTPTSPTETPNIYQLNTNNTASAPTKTNHTTNTYQPHTASGGDVEPDALAPDSAAADARSDARPDAASPAPGIALVSVAAIVPSPYQPRRVIDEEALARLAASIARSGVMQPVVVRARADGVYELVVGERRWRAAKRAGLAHIPALVRPLTDEEAGEWALVENVQREDLNAMERAHALKALCSRFGLTHGEVADRVAMDRSSVANLVRLTELEDEIAELIAKGALGAGHGKALLGMPPGAARVALATQAATEAWTVRQLEARCRQGAPKPSEPARAEGAPGAILRDLERQIGQQLGTKVSISATRGGTKGRLVVEYYGLDHFEGLLTRMGIKTV